MSSLQSGVANLMARTFRNSFFIHKAEPSTQRKNFERLSNFSKFPRFVTSEKDILGGIAATWFKPRKQNAERVILYLHGGAYVAGSVRTHRAMIARIARAAQCKAVGIDYRKAPEHPYPAALEDAMDAYRELVHLGYKYIYLAGDSAGGGLSLALMMKLRDEGIAVRPSGAALISPWTDLTMSGESIETKAHVDPLIDPSVMVAFAQKYHGDVLPTEPYISPLFGDLSNLPPVLIQVGGREVLLDDATRLAKKMKKAGGEVELAIWDNMMHVWHYLAGILPEAGEAIKDIGQFIQQHHREVASVEPEHAGSSSDLPPN